VIDVDAAGQFIDVDMVDGGPDIITNHHTAPQTVSQAATTTATTTTNNIADNVYGAVIMT